MPFLKTKYHLDLAKFPFEYTDAFAAVAPRVFYSYSPASDGVHPGWGPAAAAPLIQKYYDACGAKDAFIFKQPPGDHHFPWTWRQDSYKVIRDTLNYHPHGALGLLAERKGSEAIADLKKALDDPSQKNRWVAAHHLGLLGDPSGLARMKQDFEALAPNQGTPLPADEQGHARLVTLPSRWPEYWRNWVMQLVTPWQPNWQPTEPAATDGAPRRYWPMLQISITMCCQQETWIPLES